MLYYLSLVTEPIADSLQPSTPTSGGWGWGSPAEISTAYACHSPILPLNTVLESHLYPRHYRRVETCSRDSRSLQSCQHQLHTCEQEDPGSGKLFLIRFLLGNTTNIEQDTTLKTGYDPRGCGGILVC